MPRSRHRRKPGRNKVSWRFMGASHVRAPGEGQKMSEVVFEFIEPYRNFAHDDAAFDQLIALGVMAWNIALLPPGEREKALDELSAELLPQKRASLVSKLGGLIRKWRGTGREAGADPESPVIGDIKRIAREMVERKLQHFAYNRRCIVSYQLNTTEDDVHLFVVSTLQ
jgi:hypothetical protein